MFFVSRKESKEQSDAPSHIEMISPLFLSTNGRIRKRPLDCSSNLRNLNCSPQQILKGSTNQYSRGLQSDTFLKLSSSSSSSSSIPFQLKSALIRMNGDTLVGNKSFSPKSSKQQHHNEPDDSLLARRFIEQRFSKRSHHMTISNKRQEEDLAASPRLQSFIINKQEQVLGVNGRGSFCESNNKICYSKQNIESSLLIPVTPPVNKVNELQMTTQTGRINTMISIAGLTPRKQEDTLSSNISQSRANVCLPQLSVKTADQISQTNLPKRATTAALIHVQVRDEYQLTSSQFLHNGQSEARDIPQNLTPERVKTSNFKKYQAEKWSVCPKKGKSNRCYEALEMLQCSQLRCLFVKQKQQFLPNVLVIHFEAVFFPSAVAPAFWEKDLLQLFESCQSSNLMSGNMSLSAASAQAYLGKHKNDIKTFLKNISKKFTTILVFQSSKRSKDVFHSLLKANYSFDGAYYIEGSHSLQNDTFPLAVDYNQITQDFFAGQIQAIDSFVCLDGVSPDLEMCSKNSYSDSPPIEFLKINKGISLARSEFSRASSELSRKQDENHSSELKRVSFSNLQKREHRQEFFIGQNKPNILLASEKQRQLNSFLVSSQANCDLMWINKLPKIRLDDTCQASLVLLQKTINVNGQVSFDWEWITSLIEQSSQTQDIQKCQCPDQSISKLKRIRARSICFHMCIEGITQRHLKKKAQATKKSEYFEALKRIKASNLLLATKTKQVLETDKLIEDTRSSLLDYIQSNNLAQLLHHHFYVVGDLLMRNKDIFKAFQKKPFLNRPLVTANIFAITSLNKKHIEEENMEKCIEEANLMSNEAIGVEENFSFSAFDFLQIVIHSETAKRRLRKL